MDGLFEWIIEKKEMNESSLHVGEVKASYPACVQCDCNCGGMCLRKDNSSAKIGVCWMERGQGEY